MSKKLTCKKPHAANDECQVHMASKKDKRSKKCHVGDLENEVDVPVEKLKSKKSQVANVEHEVDMQSKKVKRSKKRHVGNVEDEVDMQLEKLKSTKSQVANVEGEVYMPSKKVKRSKKGHVGNVEDDEDRLTSLPDSLVAHILSYLCTRDAIRTSTLCREWKDKWALSYTVNVNDYNKEISPRTFCNIMDRILISTGLKLRNFHLKCRGKKYSSRLQLWISTALTHDLESFIFFVRSIPTEAHIVFPRSLINGTSLQILKLAIEMFNIQKTQMTLNVATHNFVPRLTILDLTNLEIELNGGDSSSSIVTFKFVVLKELKLMNTKWVNVKSVEIYAPCLTRLKSIMYNTQLPDYSIVVDAPMLTMFEIGDYNIRILNGSSVTCARITVEDAIVEEYEYVDMDPQLSIRIGLQIRNLFKEFTGLEILIIMNSLAYVTAPVETALYRFDHLRELTVMT